jgi:hypothetical protein
MKQKIDVKKISTKEGKVIAKKFLEIIERDWNNPEIRADYEKWLKNKKNYNNSDCL